MRRRARRARRETRGCSRSKNSRRRRLRSRSPAATDVMPRLDLPLDLRFICAGARSRAARPARLRQDRDANLRHGARDRGRAPARAAQPRAQQPQRRRRAQAPAGRAHAVHALDGHPLPRLEPAPPLRHPAAAPGHAPALPPGGKGEGDDRDGDLRVDTRRWHDDVVAPSALAVNQNKSASCFTTR